MSLTKKHADPSRKKQHARRLVSNEGVYLQKDSMDELHKKMQKLIKQTTFLPEHSRKK